MGCCLSTLEENQQNPNPTRNPLGKNHQFPCVSKSPPRSEEETVKEVLSETPKPKPELKPKPKPKPDLDLDLEIKNTKEPPKPNIIASPQKLPFSDQKLPFLEKKLPTLKPQNQIDPITPEEISEISEICSLSETISTNTLDEHHQCGLKDSANSSEVRQRVYKSQGHNSHFAKNQNNNLNNNVQLRNRNRAHGRSPVRRADPSPTRPGPGSGPGPRRDVSAENPTRRSRSPATRGNVGRSPSARKTGPSPGRVRMVNGPGPGLERVRKVENEEKSNVRRNENENHGGGPQESLENPLVSLECFIFL